MSREHIKIYDAVYSNLFKTKLAEPSDIGKEVLAKEIIEDLPVNEQIAIRAFYRYGDYHKASVMTNVNQKTFSKSIDSALRHMRSPEHIRKASPSYYDINTVVAIPMTKEDFGNKTYILHALNKSGFYYREELIKHLSLGWKYLWTIPGCGEGARQMILEALDKWNISIKNISK